MFYIVVDYRRQGILKEGVSFGISCMTTDNFCFYLHDKPVKQEVNGTVILSPLLFPAEGIAENV